MTIPNYQNCMRPLLETLADGETYAFKNVVEIILTTDLTEEERQEKLPVII
ncbi:MAG: hypothetical protein R3C11_01565 [Planctomycetaceae bacterium]